MAAAAVIARACVWCAVRVPVWCARAMQPRPNKCKLNAGDRARRRFVGSAGRIAASTAAVGPGRRLSAPIDEAAHTRDLWSHNRRRRATGTTTAVVSANGGGGGSPSSAVRWCLPVAVVGTSVGHPYRRRVVVARPATAPPTGAYRNRHGNRSPLPLTNPFSTTDRPLTPRVPLINPPTTCYRGGCRAGRRGTLSYARNIVSTLFHTRAPPSPFSSHTRFYFFSIHHS